MNIGFLQPWALLLLGFAMLPWFRQGQTALTYSSLSQVPSDPVSEWIDRGLKLIACGTFICLAIGMSGPYLREQWVDRIGTGAHIALLLDRSSSMNENFTGQYLGAKATESKSAMARKLLSEFVERRQHDLFGMVAFAAAPIYVLPLTEDREAVQAAIAAAGGRGHGVTNIAPGLAMALDFFAGKPREGSRIILLVSDGAARIDEETRDRLRQTFQETDTTLYWIYLRNPSSAPLTEKPANPNETTTPEYFLNEFFESLEVPYRAFEAENPNAMEKAIAEVERLETLPLPYREKLPRKDLSDRFFATALGLMILLLGARALEVKTWHT
ncbi:MAG: VWA domain-containing protein [Methylococcaceae bacterium]|nr:VWA domain-containing protein [Methylococcaceae bacterium]